MRSEKDVEAYLLKLNRRFTTVGDPLADGAPTPSGRPATFLVQSSDAMPPVALRVEAPLVVLRVHIGDAPNVNGSEHGALFRKLLELNARSLVHASYGLEDDRIVLSAALELENLDFNELEATLDEIDMALAQQVPGLASIAGLAKKSGPASTK